MMNLKQYEDRLKELVASENDSDENWKWKLKEVTDTKARIWWEYLEYIGSEDECFTIELDIDDGSGIGDWLFAKTPEGEIIECWMVTDVWPSSLKIGALCELRGAVNSAVIEITYYAHSRY